MPPPLEERAILDRVGNAVILSDAKGSIIYWNRGAEEIYGWSAKEALGENVHALLRTTFCDGAQELALALEDGLRKRSRWAGELRQIRRNGTEVYVASHWSLASDEQDALRVQINSDITVRKQAEETLRECEERYRRFVEEDFTGNLIMHPDGRIITCNPAFARIFGFDSIEEARSANFMSLLRSRKEGSELFDLVRQGETIDTHELELRQRDGEPVYVVARFIGSFDEKGELTALQGYLFNDTKRKRLEQQLMQAQKMEGSRHAGGRHCARLQQHSRDHPWLHDAAGTMALGSQSHSGRHQSH